MSKERRTAQRYPVKLELEYRVFGRDHSVTVGSGATVNMSSRGLLIQTADPVTRGGMIELSVRLPESSGTVSAANLVILGQVVRCDSDGVAVRILRHGFFHGGATAMEPVQETPLAEPKT